MIRNLKILIVAAMALAAFGSFAAAANALPKFTAPGAGATGLTTITSERDIFNVPKETTAGKTSHHVFDVRNAAGTAVLSITCNEASATNAWVNGESTDRVSSTVDFRGSAENPNCSFAGQNTVTVSTGNCEFLITASGLLHINDDGVQNPKNHCEIGEKPIVFENTEIACKVEVGAQTITGIGYHNITQGGVGQITLEATNLAIEYHAAGAGCPWGTTTNGLYTTGNTILKGTRGASVAIAWGLLLVPNEEVAR